ncbi:MAG: UDP-N-acetylmuramoyl-L-alanine--D-glutamate ligase [Lachnospiraceae bacterium]|nr:UDP-N-acetylmuramoyl-L-alanine--D-glutamate ligase [Lachnospiraceae bacterium]
MNSIINKLTDKRILIFGYGREGKSTEQYIKNHVQYKCLDVFEGKMEEINEDDYDFIIKSPGIIMLEDNPKYTSQTELFLDEFSEKTIGITGTKGKSTTSAMIAHVLNECGKKAVLLGNIGKPCFDMIDEIDKDTWVVFELSCHQLLHINWAPHVAVFLNLYEEHLDYYGTMDKYFAAKANIISHQTEDDICFVGENVPKIDHKSKDTIINGPLRDFELQILGEHNKTNAEFVYQVAAYVLTGRIETRGKVLLDETKLLIEASIKKAISSFKGLPHRLEYFAEIDGVKYYDDSISTIPEACINAIESVENAATVIVGGMDRGIDYDILVDFILKREDILFILCYATGRRICEMMGFYYEDNSIYPDEFGNVMSTAYMPNPKEQEKELPHNVMLTINLDYAVKIAKDNTKPGKACILSPAAPSYGYFKNFEERGDYFKEIVESK